MVWLESHTILSSTLNVLEEAHDLSEENANAFFVFQQLHRMYRADLPRILILLRFFHITGEHIWNIYYYLCRSSLKRFREYDFESYPHHVIPLCCWEDLADEHPGAKQTLRALTPLLSLEEIRNIAHEWETYGIRGHHILWLYRYHCGSDVRRLRQYAFRSYPFQMKPESSRERSTG